MTLGCLTFVSEKQLTQKIAYQRQTVNKKICEVLVAALLINDILSQAIII